MERFIAIYLIGCLLALGIGVARIDLEQPDAGKTLFFYSAVSWITVGCTIGEAVNGLDNIHDHS